MKASYLASPPLVVAYLLVAGTLDWDPECEPIGMGVDGPVMLADVWPSQRRCMKFVVSSHRRCSWSDTPTP